jgi:hypothetical protein
MRIRITAMPRTTRLAQSPGVLSSSSTTRRDGAYRSCQVRHAEIGSVGGDGSSNRWRSGVCHRICAYLHSSCHPRPGSALQREQSRPSAVAAGWVLGIAGAVAAVIAASDALGAGSNDAPLRGFPSSRSFSGQPSWSSLLSSGLGARRPEIPPTFQYGSALSEG